MTRIDTRDNKQAVRFAKVGRRMPKNPVPLRQPEPEADYSAIWWAALTLACLVSAIIWVRYA